MKTEVEKLEKGKVKIKVEVPKETIKKAIEKAYKSISNKVSIPGFRRGKVPKKVIDAHMGKDVVYNEMLQDSISDFYSEAVDVSGIEPVTQPELEVDPSKVTENSSFEFSATVQVKPEVSLGNYKNLEIKKKSPRVTKKEVEKVVDDMLERFSTLEVADKKIEEGDYALIDFKGFQNGKKLKEGADAEDYLVEVRSGMLLEKFEKELIGHKKGDKLEFSVKIPKKHYMKDIAGQNVDFKVKIKEVKVKNLPEKDDKFAKEVGEYDSLIDLEKKIRENLRRKKKRDAELEFQNMVMDKIIDDADMDVPQQLVDNRVSTMFNQFVESLHKQGISLDEYLDVTKSNQEKVRQEFKKDAEKQIRSALILEAIAKKEKLEVSDDDLNEELEKSAQQLNYPKEKLLQMAAQQGDLDSIKNKILANKVVDFLVEKNEASIKGKTKTKKKSEKKEKRDTKKEKKVDIKEEKVTLTDEKKETEAKKIEGNK